MTVLFSELKFSEVEIILDRLKVSKAVFSRVKRLHFLLDKSPNNTDMRLYRNSIGEDVVAHASIRKSLGRDTECITKSLEFPVDIKCLVDGKWIMERTGLNPGIKLGRLKDWLFRIQIERGYSNPSQIETALCTLPWQHGNPEEWPKPKWP